MIPDAHLFLFHAQPLQPVDAELLPISEPLQIRIRLAEKFQFHLFKLPRTERKIARRDLVTERFPDLADAERNLLPGSPLYIFKIHKNPLCGLRP